MTNAETRRKNVQYQLALQKKKMALVRAYKGSIGCGICGETDPIVLELHHRDPAAKNPKLKQRRYGKAMQRTGGDFWRRLSFVEIADELGKCDVLCANCHRRVSHQQRMANKEAADALVESVSIEQMSLPF